jgi:hypothetical protein
VVGDNHVEHSIPEVFESLIVQGFFSGIPGGRLVGEGKLKQAKIFWPVFQHLPESGISIALWEKSF